MKQTAKRSMLQACKVVGEEQGAGEKRCAGEEWGVGEEQGVGEEWGIGKEWGEGEDGSTICQTTLSQSLLPTLTSRNPLTSVP